MGLPALRHEAPRGASPRLVPAGQASPTRARGRAAPRPKVCHSLHCREAFRTFVAISVLFAGLGIVRVALASRAASVSIEAGRMRAQVREARFEGDSLEIKISQLATPSRIRAIASKKMKMAPAAGIWYMTIDGAAEQRPAAPEGAAGGPADDNTSRASEKAGGSLLASVMHTAAGEAQVLLLGDVGLSSSR